MKIKMKIYAVLSGTSMTYISPEEMNDPEKLAKYIYFSAHDKRIAGDIALGETQVELDILTPDEVRLAAVEALREQASEIRAKATKECTAIEGQIQQLLCIENKPS